jgi:DNA-binding NarL/FixJ family response regulator
MRKISVLLVEDHETVRQGLKLLIDGQPDMEVIAEAGSGREALALADTRHPAVAVIDISMPDINGLTATRQLKERAPRTGVVALTRYNDHAYVKEMLGAGALAYVLKKSRSDELLAAIRAAAAGRQYLDTSLASEPSSFFKSPSGGGGPRLTARESDVLRMMALGHSNKEIASSLDVTVKTIEVHKANAMRKLELKGRTDVVKFAVLQGWLREPDEPRP